MCLFTVRKEEDDDLYVANRHVVRREEHYRSSSPRRSSRVVVARTSEPRVVVPTPAQIPLPPPRGKILPVPQPVPIFVEPTPPPPPPLSPPEVHYVHVSPRSSVSDHSDYRYERREVRYERDYSPTRSHRSHHGDNYEYRYVNGPVDEVPRHRRRERSRSRSRSRVGDYYEDDDRERRTNVRVSRKIYVDRDGNRDDRY